MYVLNLVYIVVNWIVYCIWKYCTCVCSTLFPQCTWVSAASLSQALCCCPLSITPLTAARFVRRGVGTNSSMSPDSSRLFCHLLDRHLMVYPMNSSPNIMFLFFSPGFGQCSCTSVHLSPEDAPAVFAICRGKDLSGQEGWGGFEKAAGWEEKAGPRDAEPHWQPEGGLEHSSRYWIVDGAVLNKFVLILGFFFLAAFLNSKWVLLKKFV